MGGRLGNNLRGRWGSVRGSRTKQKGCGEVVEGDLCVALHPQKFVGLPIVFCVLHLVLFFHRMPW